jgi:large subunit ribosomal protein L28
LTGKGVLVGNNVSHANNKTKRRFLPNLQKVSFMSNVLDGLVKLRVSTKAIRTVDLYGGLDEYMKRVNKEKLGDKALKIRKIILKKLITTSPKIEK